MSENLSQINIFFHCRKCIEELPKGVSPRDFIKVEVGLTSVGVQVWCQRHECNIVHIDFEGVSHPVVKEN
jgi:hypothetical protein